MGLRPVRSSPTLLRSNCNALLNLATVNIFVYLENGDSNVPSPIHGLGGRILRLALDCIAQSQVYRQVSSHHYVRPHLKPMPGTRRLKAWMARAFARISVTLGW